SRSSRKASTRARRRRRKSASSARARSPPTGPTALGAGRRRPMSRIGRLARAPDDAPRRPVKTKVRWIIGGAIIATVLASGRWLILKEAPAYQFLVRPHVDKRFLKHALREWGVLWPVIFIGLQAFEVSLF